MNSINLSAPKFSSGQYILGPENQLVKIKQTVPNGVFGNIHHTSDGRMLLTDTANQNPLFISGTERLPGRRISCKTSDGGQVIISKDGQREVVPPEGTALKFSAYA
jgi:hypothetical protein